MTTAQFATIMESVSYPVRLETTGGRSYELTAAGQYWVPGPLPELVCLVIPREGIRWLKMSEIETVQVEHAVAR
jgi:hypothetical protein